jgi:DHA1 family multidrug resistance protein-like MFS transporter
VLRVFAIRFLFSSALRMVSPLLPLLVQSLATDKSRVASHMGVMSSVYMATMALGTVVAGRYAVRLGVRRVLMGCLLAAAGLYLPQSVVVSVSQLLLLRALTGLAIGGLVSSLSAQLAEAAPEGRQGAVFGLQSTVHSVANAVAPVAGGALAASMGLRVPFVLAGLALALASVVLVYGRMRTAGGPRT